MPQRKPLRKPSQTRKPGLAGAQLPGGSGQGKSLSNGLAYTILALFSLLAFANAWPDSLTFDDRIFADSSRFADLGAGDVVRFFTEDLWAASAESSSLYRPLLLLLIAGESLLFGDWLPGYHLVNIGLHMLATAMVFSFLSRLFQSCGQPSAEARRYSLLAALVFAVHPIHTEVVNSVFNSSEILVTMGVAGGLGWFLERQGTQAVKAWLGLNLVFLLVLFCRESGAALPLLVVAIIWLTSTESWLQRLRACIPVLSMCVPLAIYLALRFHALAAPATNDEVTPDAVASLADYGMDIGLAKLAPAVLFWFESLKHLLWPYPLQIYYDPPQTNVWLALAAQLALLAGGLAAYLRRQPLLLTGLAFFYLAILPSSRIISEPGVQAILSDRALYLPSVGFVIALAWALQWLTRKTSFNTAVVATVAITLVMVPVTLNRNADWSGDIRLFEADYRKLEDKDPILATLLSALLREGQVARAVEVCDGAREMVRSGRPFGAHCGDAYARAGRFRDAEQSYLSVRRGMGRIFADFNLGLLYLHLNRRAEAEERLAMAVAAEPKPFMKKYFEAVALIQLHPANREKLLQARTLLEEALELQPQHIDSRLELETLNRQLNGEPPSR